MPPGIIVKSQEESDLQVMLQVSRGSFTRGDEYAELLNFSLNKPAFVYLLHISPPTGTGEQEVRLLFPNRSFPINYLETKLDPDKYTFPGPGLFDRGFEILGPEGTAYVQAIATPVDIGLAPLEYPEQFPLLGRNAAAVRAEILRLIGERGLQPADWVASWDRYEITAGGPVGGEMPGILRVTVTDCTSKDPVVGALIRLDGEPRADTKQGGIAIVPFLKPGSYTMRISHWNYEDHEETVTIESEKQTDRQRCLQRRERFVSLRVIPDKPRQLQEVTLDASESKGPIILYHWSFDHIGLCIAGEPFTVIRSTTAPRVTHIYEKAGDHTAAVMVVFQDGETALACRKVSVIPLPSPPPPEPGTTWLSPGAVGVPNIPVVNPVILTLVQGKVEFVVMSTFHTLNPWGRYFRGQPPSLSFQYSFGYNPLDPKKTLLPKNLLQDVRFQSYLEVRFWNDQGQIGTQRFLTFDNLSPGPPSSHCGGIEREKLFQTQQCRSGEGQTPPLQPPAGTTEVVITIALEITRNPNNEGISVKYENLVIQF
jgi:hypothetical protein